MSGFLVGQLILWLIVALIVIVVAVYIVNWLYHRSSKEVSFVRTGFLGEQVVINGGAFVLPFIHDFTPVNMNVLPMPIIRSKQDAVITRDRMRIDIEADFYVRVQPTREAVSIAAATLGRRTLEPEKLHTLLSGKFVSAMRSVASEMTMEQMHEKRGEYVARVKAAAAEALAQVLCQMFGSPPHNARERYDRQARADEQRRVIVQARPVSQQKRHWDKSEKPIE